MDYESITSILNGTSTVMLMIYSTMIYGVDHSFAVLESPFLAVGYVRLYSIGYGMSGSICCCVILYFEIEFV